MAIYNGTQKIDMTGIDKVYVGIQLVYQKSSPIVLDYITLANYTTSLEKGSAFSFGGTVTAHYTNGTTADVTSSTTFSGYNMSVEGTYTVTASYTENGVTKTATYQLTVTKAWTTIWTGNTKYGYKGTTTSGTLATVSFVDGMKFRATFNNMSGSIQSGDSGSVTYTPSDRVSPYTTPEITSSILSQTILEVYANNTSRIVSYTVTLFWEKASSAVKISVNPASNTTRARAAVTLTKIELYS